MYVYILKSCTNMAVSIPTNQASDILFMKKTCMSRQPLGASWPVSGHNDIQWHSMESFWKWRRCTNSISSLWGGGGWIEKHMLFCNIEWWVGDLFCFGELGFGRGWNIGGVVVFIFFAPRQGLGRGVWWNWGAKSTSQVTGAWSTLFDSSHLARRCNVTSQVT